MLQLVPRDVDEVAVQAAARVVDEQVDAQAGALGPLEERRRCGGIGQVERDDGDLHAVLVGQLPGERLEVLGAARGDDEVRAAGREVRELPLARDGDRYVMDFEAYAPLMTGRERMVILCSPHNPGGRVWSPAELEQVAEISGGQAFTAPTSEQLTAVYRDLGSRLTYVEEKRELTSYFMGGAAVLLLLGAAASITWFLRLP